MCTNDLTITMIVTYCPRGDESYSHKQYYKKGTTRHITSPADERLTGFLYENDFLCYSHKPMFLPIKGDNGFMPESVTVLI